MMDTPQVFLLHFAGGSNYSYNFFKPYIQHAEMITIELPGRGRRMKEELISDFDLAVEDAMKQIMTRNISSRFVVYGHSMGSQLALKVSYKLEAIGKIPKCTFLSGNPGPGVKKNQYRYLLNDPEFISAVRKIGGMPEELLKDDEYLQLFLPILRADFEVSENHSLNDDIKLKSPIFAMMGNEEEDHDKLDNWKRFTSGKFRSNVFTGGHFFIRNHPEQISKIIMEPFLKRP